MVEHKRNDDFHKEDQHVGHELSDARIAPLVTFGAVLVLVTVLVFLAMTWMFNYFEDREARTALPASPVSEGKQQPPTPQLQVDPAIELRELREREERILNSYGWVDREEQIVRIPIERAIELLSEKGIPHRQDSEADGPRTGLN